MTRTTYQLALGALVLGSLVGSVSCSEESNDGAGGTTVVPSGGNGGEAGATTTTSSGTGGDASGGTGGGIPEPVPPIGPRPVAPTPAADGTLYAAPNGSGTACSFDEPCDIWEAADQAVAGDVAFLRGGTYDITQSLYFRGDGTTAQRILFESYPGEHAILDGGNVPAGDDVRVRITGSFYALRRFEIANMPRQGLWIGGTDNLIEGLHTHHNHLSGIQVYSDYAEFPYGAYGSRNTIRDSISNDNFDEGTAIPGFANGGNADGIAFSSGAENRIEHCLVYNNSDDGIDTWRSTDSYVGYTIAHTQGVADGNANGIKAGGQPPAARTVVEHCIAYGNHANGIDYNSGVDVEFRFNTTYQNDGRGYVLGDTTTAEHNIASGDGNGDVNSNGTQTDNSWDRGGTVQFVSEGPTSEDFLRPTPGGGFEDIGAYAGL
ncbi:MAG: right-handed parallel beta-helix repeat-containing protein [Deltaproteobacteria bacterium]|jgi:hypothetical protein|nr:right-handed parallel beta-helix repeat-containing protein [Deltaproteobacteria bacterium]MBW2534325.1 right-handed parallel beta-helix repeat-containing protein [Deltaproteobacteria bacterium]